MLCTPWDTLHDVAVLELTQREYEGAAIPRELCGQIEALLPGGDDRRPDEVLPLLTALARLEIDPNFEYVQPNDLAEIRRERPGGPRRLPLALSPEQLRNR